MKPTETKKLAEGVTIKEDGTIVLNQIDQQILNLIKLLKESGRINSNSDFGEPIGMKKQSISDISAGRRRFTVDAIINICEVYGVNSGWLFGYDNNVFRRYKST